MTTPVVAQKAPYAMELPAGDYFWCQCGRSNNQPFCDGSHTGSSFNPVKFTLMESKKVWLCGCKHSGKQPFCDGTHSQV